ncbi:MAG TPA: GldG family protein [Verrucomicrobiae bacterium]|nr:GldG family protein [Verrucomicrobiae bacterium]
MSSDPILKSQPPSFSPGRRWKIAFDLLLRTLVVLAVVVMLNYIGGLFSRQFFLSPQTRVKLSPHTVSILRSLTNHVDVTVYYDKNDRMYSTVMALLDEYHRLDPRIRIKMVDYVRDPGEAAVITQKYHLPAQGVHPDEPPAKNLIIFDCNGHAKAIPGDALVQLGPNGIVKDKQIEFGPVAFKGEMAFTATLLAITNPKPFTAYYMIGQGEPSPTDTGDNGYLKFGAILGENYVRLAPLTLSGDSGVPTDCNLLIIAGPRQRFTDSQLTKIEHYIAQGGRLLVMLDYFTASQPTGIEDVLADYGVIVGGDTVLDRNTPVDNAVEVLNFNQKQPVVNPLIGSELELILPRPVGPKNDPNAPPNAPTVVPLAASSDNSVLYGERGAPPRSFPLMVAVEGNSANKGAANSMASLRMIVAGDSMFLNNKFIEAGANRDFAGYAVNWLLDRPMLLNGIGPRPVTEYRLLMTTTQLRNVRWLLIGALPASALALGGLVWLRRRK